MAAMEKIIECIPNFSEGKNTAIIQEIANEIRKIDQVYLLDIDQGESVNRSVMTFAGHPGKVTEAAFNAVKKASELIDMQVQQGHHPRIGATDVCPLVPLQGITMAETIDYAHALGERIGNELNIPVYCYEEAAFKEARKNLAQCRKGGYEQLEDRISEPEGKPDFGPATINKKAGATAVGARDILIAYNINLNTPDVTIAKEIAQNIRETSSLQTTPGNGHQRLKHVKAIGWYIPEFNRTQVSMNITNHHEAPLYQVYERVEAEAQKHHLTVTGSELIGLIPKKALFETGLHAYQQEGSAVPEDEAPIIQKAIRFLGLNELYPFNPQDKVLEYAISQAQKMYNL